MDYKKTASSFMALQASADAFKNAVTLAFEQFQTADNLAKQQSREFKDESAKYETARFAAASTTRATVGMLERSFTDTVKREAGTLRNELKSLTQMEPAPELLNALRTYRDYRVRPSRTELDHLLELANNSPLALQAIQNVLKDVDSPFSLDFITVAELEKDLDFLDRLSQGGFHWSPQNAHSQACRVWESEPIPGQPGRNYDNTSLLLARSAFEDNLKTLVGMVPRWTENAAPKVVEKPAFDPVEHARQLARSRLGAKIEDALR